MKEPCGRLNVWFAMAIRSAASYFSHSCPPEHLWRDYFPAGGRCFSQNLPAEGKVTLNFRKPGRLIPLLSWKPQLAFLGEGPSFLCYLEVIPFRSKSSLC